MRGLSSEEISSNVCFIGVWLLITISLVSFVIVLCDNESDEKQEVCKEYGGVMTRSNPVVCLYDYELYKFINTYDGWKIPSLEKYVLGSKKE